MVVVVVVVVVMGKITTRYVYLLLSSGLAKARLTSELHSGGYMRGTHAMAGGDMSSLSPVLAWNYTTCVGFM